MKTFLVPVDFSPITDKVVEAAMDFARAFNGQVELLHVVQAPVVATAEYALPAEVVQEAVTVSQNHSGKKLDEMAARVRRTGLICSAKTQVGTPVHLIREEAAKINADFIVMGSHGHGKLYDFLVGSTASGVLHKSKSGVIIIPADR